MKVYINPAAESRLSNASAALVGCFHDGAIWVLQALPGAAASLDSADAAQLEDLLPYGLRLCGTYSPDGVAAVSSSTALPYVLAGKQAGAVRYSVHTDGQQSTAEAAADSSLAAGAVSLPSGYLVARCTLPVTLDVFHYASAAGGSSLAQAVQQAGQRLQQHMANAELALVLTDGSPGARHVVLPSTQGTLSELLGSSSSSSSSSKGRAVQVQVLLSGSPSSASSSPPAAPTLTYQPVAPGASIQHYSACLSLDVACYLPASTPCASLAAGMVRPALLQQLQRALALTLQGGQLVPVSAHHFLPPGFSTFVTVLYPCLSMDAELAEAKLKDRRMRLHQLLGLPTDRPALRLANQVDPLQLGMEQQQQQQAGSSRLRDVHATLPDPPLGGTSHLLQGSYDYYHYMQDRFNDAGWGCAYRSLQTLCSWFLAQRYTSRPVPGHREVQQLLVQLGDKEPAFVGSSKWIGATELMYVLDSYLGITSKVLFISRGSEIPSHARELAQHFRTQGTPVMIGGGVLAYTLLGVHFNEQTGGCAFLILDPHYTGGEDLKKVQAGGWVGWKRPGDSAAAGGPLFVPDAFYNFLLPQRPGTV